MKKWIDKIISNDHDTTTLEIGVIVAIALGMTLITWGLAALAGLLT